MQSELKNQEEQIETIWGQWDASRIDMAALSEAMRELFGVAEVVQAELALAEIEGQDDLAPSGWAQMVVFASPELLRSLE